MKDYRKECLRAIRELLAHRGKMVVELYVLRAKGAKSETELSRLMVDVRSEI